jgi:hypothetical protein
LIKKARNNPDHTLFRKRLSATSENECLMDWARDFASNFVLKIEGIRTTPVICRHNWDEAKSAYHPEHG